MNKKIYNIQRDIPALPPPILIVSSFVGRGDWSIGEAIQQQFGDGTICYHMAIEDLLPPNALQEDFQRYKWILNNLKFLLYLIYTIPFFYYRKYIREKYFCVTDLSVLEKKIRDLNINTIICISHRPAFWLSLLKYRSKLNFSLWGVLADFGPNLAWRHIFWNEMNGLFSVIPREQLKLNFPLQVSFKKLQLPCRKEFLDIASFKGDKNNLLLVAGYWGLLSKREAIDLITALLTEFPDLNIHAICGTNEILEKELKDSLGSNDHVKIYGKVNSLLDLMRICASIITKPGFSTLTEAYCASRKIFILKGIPITEDRNAAYAINNFAAQWHSIEHFREWYFAA